MKIAKTLVLLVGFLFACNTGFGIAAEQKDPKKAQKKKSEFITQGEFMADIVTTLGWEGGLPPEPRDRHFLAILSGKRNFKFEAENVYGVKTDKVAVKKHALYGSFSGNGWVSGTATPTPVHFKFFIPLGGTYTLYVASKGDGQKWQLGGKEFVVNTGTRLAEAKAGSLELKAGPQEITMVIPPDGAVDYFVLDAPTLRPIAPVKGWNAKATLTKGDLAEITAVLLDLDRNLPDSGKPVTLPVSEIASLPPSTKPTAIDYLGKPIAKQWVRADYRGAVIDVPFTLDADGLYAIRARMLGESISAEIDSNKALAQGKPFLEWVDLGYYRLEKGDHKLKALLGPSQGIDTVEITAKKGSLQDYMAACGIDGDPSAPVKRTEEDKILASLSEKFKGRK